ncbi:hypothetical protein BDC45DRAFT_527005 [Circinella umbellata]|nr:hypothetical protein BDC45DRAFT_527005 [Circinella umbellata]
MATVHLIQQYGSRQLRHICIDTAQQFDENIYATRNCYQTYIDTSCYDYTIDVHNWGSKATASLLLQLINHSIDMKQKIKALSLSLAHCSQVDDWNAFKYFTAPCLQYLRFSFTEQTEEIFASVIRNCPTIQDISIFRLLSPPTDIIIDALITLPLLQCFAIENIKNEVFEDEHYSFDYYYDYDFFPISYSDINSVPIQRFFQYHVSLDNQSTLQEVRLRHIQNLDPSAFYTLYKIKSLKSLNFAGPDVLYGIRHYQGGSNAVGWATVITDKQECLLPDQIEDLVLEDSKAISDSDLEFLDIPSITIGELSALKITAIQKMMTNAQKLKKLTVFDYGEFQEDGEILEDTAKRNNISLEIVMRN